jgi:uncharacterized protein (TIGR00255 family)
MLSMTGYGRSEALIEGRKWIIEVKSLNHRYIEIITRLPGVLSSLEVDIKKRVGERIFRGRIEVSIRASRPMRKPARTTGSSTASTRPCCATITPCC